MNRIINPYNVVPFYTEPLDEHQSCPLYSSTYRLPPFQVQVNSYPSAYSASLHTLDGTQVLSLSVDATSGSDGTTWIDYKGINLASVQDEGRYRVHMTVEGTTYYSHVLCAEEGFRLQDWSGALISCASGGGGSYQFNVAFFLAAPNMATAIEANFGTGYRQIGTTSGAITQDDITGSGSVNVDLRFRVFFDGGDFYRQYRLSFDTSDPCGTDTYTLTRIGGHNIDRYCYLEFENSTDLQSMGLFYQTGYVQRFYFKNHPRFPVPVTEETFIRNGQNDQVLESAAVAEQINLDCYPVPDHLLSVLSAVRYHDTVKVVSTMDMKETTLENYSFTSRTTENDLCAIGTLQGEVNRVWLAGCQENVTL